MVAIKYANGVVDAGTVALFGDPPCGCSLLAGDDALLTPLLALGAHGAVLSSAHLATGRFAELIEAGQAGSPMGRPLAQVLSAYSAAAFAEPNPSVVKGLLHRAGLIPTPAVRLPLLPAGDAAVREGVRAVEAVERAGTGPAGSVTSRPSS